MFKKIIATIFVLMIIFGATSIVSATGLLDNIIDQGNDFSNSASDDGLFDTIRTTLIESKIIPAIGAIGNLIFAAITVILGVKYIWSSAEGKASVLESLPTFVVAVVFFYLAGTVVEFMTGATTDISNSLVWNSFAGRIIWIINTAVKYLAMGGIVYTGLRYMFASAEGKASMKTSMGGLVIGLLFTFLATNIIGFIVQTANSII